MTSFATDLDAYRAALVPALAASSLDHWRGAVYASTEHRVADHSVLTGLLHEGGWNRYGWPESAGGLGGDERHRAALYDTLSDADLPVPEQLLLLETVAPAVLRFAPDLAATYLPRCLQGDEWWAQAFGESPTDDDLSSIICSARRDGENYVLSGRKTWTRQGATAKRLLCLVRTSADEHEAVTDGLSVLLVDVETPGVSVRPVALASGYNELAEITFDDAVVPADRRLGPEGDGWDVLEYLLPVERGQLAWLQSGVLLRYLRRLRGLLSTDRAHAPEDGAERRLGRCYSDVITLRARGVQTVRRLAGGDTLAAETVVDDLLLASASTAVFDLARELLGGDFVLNPQAQLQGLRADWWASRLPTISDTSPEARLRAVADLILPTGVSG